MTYFHDTPENVAALASVFGMPSVAAQGWLRCEGQAADNPTNPLNIMRTFVAHVGYAPGGYAIFTSAQAGIAAAYQIVMQLAPGYGYARLLTLRGSQDAAAWAKAIEVSNWAGGHYQSDWAHGVPGCISRFVAAHAVPTTPAHVSVETSMAPVARVSVPANTRRWSLSGEPLSKIGPSTLTVTSLDVLSGLINGHFYRTGTTPAFYVSVHDVTPVTQEVPPVNSTPVTVDIPQQPTIRTVDFDDADFLKRFGFTPAEYVGRCIVSTLHPDPARWVASDGAPIDTVRYGDQYRQAIVASWLAGQATWATMTSALGPYPNQLISEGIAVPSDVLAYVEAHS